MDKSALEYCRRVYQTIVNCFYENEFFCELLENENLKIYLFEAAKHPVIKVIFSNETGQIELASVSFDPYNQTFYIPSTHIKLEFDNPLPDYLQPQFYFQDGAYVVDFILDKFPQLKCSND